MNRYSYLTNFKRPVYRFGRLGYLDTFSLLPNGLYSINGVEETEEILNPDGTSKLPDGTRVAPLELVEEWTRQANREMQERRQRQQLEDNLALAAEIDAINRSQFE